MNFYKYQGTGNDFIMIDNRGLDFDLNTKQIAKLCDRRFGIGADGLILLQNGRQNDEMVYFNSDGNPSTMCGNGGRCFVKFLADLHLIQEKVTFSAVDGLHHAAIENDIVSLGMNPVENIEIHDDFCFLDTGSPHHVVFVKNVNELNVFEKGKEIRYSEKYAPQGTNVNFVEIISANQLFVRTYERGVEDETYSCGTGVTAAAIAAFATGKCTAKEINIETLGGNLQVKFDVQNDLYQNIYLCGPAVRVFEGKINL